MSRENIRRDVLERAVKEFLHNGYEARYDEIFTGENPSDEGELLYVGHDEDYGWLDYTDLSDIIEAVLKLIPNREMKTDAQKSVETYAINNGCELDVAAAKVIGPNHSVAGCYDWLFKRRVR